MRHEHVDGVECAATRLCISDDPVVGWEMGLSEELADGCERVRDESQQADLVTFGAESGGVVWLGRTKTGDVAAIVVTSCLPDAKA
ncbi:hypothetical protein [Streptomyces erythrochromogenes]|uniref:hypothetical protein n=1 Tax=Streptomyces erythrochromogenes TaxID=285574 RepID=UPI0036ACA2A0